MVFVSTVDMGLVRARHAELQPHSHWFSLGARRFFNTRMPRRATVVGNEYWFVTSEAPPPGTDRAFSVRVMRADGRIETPAGLRAYPSSYTAHKALLAAVGASLYRK